MNHSATKFYRWGWKLLLPVFHYLLAILISLLFKCSLFGSTPYFTSWTTEFPPVVWSSSITYLMKYSSSPIECMVKWPFMLWGCWMIRLPQMWHLCWTWKLKVNILGNYKGYSKTTDDDRMKRRQLGIFDPVFDRLLLWILDKKTSSNPIYFDS